VVSEHEKGIKNINKREIGYNEILGNIGDNPNFKSNN